MWVRGRWPWAPRSLHGSPSCCRGTAGTARGRHGSINEACTARNAEGIAGAAAMGLWGTVVFSVIDIVLLRPVRAYPWTWDAVGGGTTWWYLPMWWILGTFLAWMGGTRIALSASRGEATGLRVAVLPLAGAVVVAALAKVAGLAVVLPVAAGAGFAVTLSALAVIALARSA